MPDQVENGPYKFQNMINLNAQNTQVLEIKTSKGIKYISQNRIVYIKAENKGTNINMNNSEKVFVTRN